MSIIYPGNYVAQLNAYREQGVEALPGVEFFKGIGALVLNPDNYGALNTDGVLEAGTYDLWILSPDLRQDDKPRKDKPFVVPPMCRGPAGASASENGASTTPWCRHATGTRQRPRPCCSSTATTPASTKYSGAWAWTRRWSSPAPIGMLSASGPKSLAEILRRDSTPRSA